MTKTEMMAWIFRALFFVTYVTIALIQDKNISHLEKLVQHLK